MPAPKGHLPYAGCEKGAPYGYLAKGENSWTEEEAIQLGVELIQWHFISRKNIWRNVFFTEVAKVDLSLVEDLEKRYAGFKKFTNRSRQIQESRLVDMPLDKTSKGIDGYHSRWVLARHHKGQWEEKSVPVEQKDEDNINKGMQAVDFLQSKTTESQAVDDK